MIANNSMLDIKEASIEYLARTKIDEADLPGQESRRMIVSALVRQ
jgi:hypothetical protein